MKKLIGDPDKLADAFKVLSNPVRIMIIHQLLATSSCINADLVNVIPRAQATISQHLKVLIKADLITSKKAGKYSIYYIKKSNYRDMTELMHLFISHNQIN